MFATLFCRLIVVLPLKSCWFVSYLRNVPMKYTYGTYLWNVPVDSLKVLGDA